MKTFGEIAIALAKNPLGIIALFIVLIYGITGAVTTSTELEPTTRLILVCFLAGFPLIVLAVFYVLVTKHHFKLYSPEDLEGKRDFIRLVRVQSSAEARKEIQEKIEFIEEARPAIESAVSGNEPSQKLLTLQYIARFSSGDIRALIAEIKDIPRHMEKADEDKSFKVFALINFFEEIAVAIREHLVDEAMMKSVMRSRVVFLWDALQDGWIEPMREYHGSSTYECLEQLVGAWREGADASTPAPETRGKAVVAE